jgi:hypothetical protein
MLDLDVTQGRGEEARREDTKQGLLCLALWPTSICKTKDALRFLGSCSITSNCIWGEPRFIQPKAVIPASDADVRAHFNA